MDHSNSNQFLPNCCNSKLSTHNWKFSLKLHHKNQNWIIKKKKKKTCGPLNSIFTNKTKFFLKNYIHSKRILASNYSPPRWKKSNFINLASLIQQKSEKYGNSTPTHDCLRHNSIKGSHWILRKSGWKEKKKEREFVGWILWEGKWKWRGLQCCWVTLKNGHSVVHDSWLWDPHKRVFLLWGTTMVWFVICLFPLWVFFFLLLRFQCSKTKNKKK